MKLAQWTFPLMNVLIWTKVFMYLVGNVVVKCACVLCCGSDQLLWLLTAIQLCIVSIKIYVLHRHFVYPNKKMLFLSFQITSSHIFRLFLWIRNTPQWLMHFKCLCGFHCQRNNFKNSTSIVCSVLLMTINQRKHKNKIFLFIIFCYSSNSWCLFSCSFNNLDTSIK